MFSLELNKTVPPPPGISGSVAEASSLFSSLAVSEFQKTDEEFMKIKEKVNECSKCSVLVRVCDKMFAHKQKTLVCLLDTFNIIQKESVLRLRTQGELDELRNLKGLNEELSGPYKKIKALNVELKKKEKILSDLMLENRELTKNRINVEKLLIQMQKDVIAKAETIKKMEKCEKCEEKDEEIRSKGKNIKELQESIQFLTVKLSENFKLGAEHEMALQKIENFAFVLNFIPEVNGRDLRMSIHRKICEIETDFIELAPNVESFETIKEKYLQLPYLLKPIFDLTKQYEKTLVELKKIIYA